MRVRVSGVGIMAAADAEDGKTKGKRKRGGVGGGARGASKALKAEAGASAGEAAARSDAPSEPLPPLAPLPPRPTDPDCVYELTGILNHKVSAVLHCASLRLHSLSLRAMGYAFAHALRSGPIGVPRPLCG